MGDRIKRYLDCHIPVTRCNLRCSYCYVTQELKYSNSIPCFEYQSDYVAKALSRKRLGGVCLVNLCGAGETTLVPELPEIIRALLQEGHYVSVVTNGTIRKFFDEIFKFPTELLSRLFIKFSFHYLELVRLRLLDLFFNVIDEVRKAGASFSLELTPFDDLVPHIPAMQQVCLDRVGAMCHVTVARNERLDDWPILTNYSKDDYYAIWSQFDSKMFEYKMSVFGLKQTDFCYAGENALAVDLYTGIVRQCYRLKIIDYKNIEEPINFEPVGVNCPDPHCVTCHAVMTLGCMPSSSSEKNLTYAETRNRVCVDGSEWLTPKMKAFMSTKFKIKYKLIDSIINKFRQAKLSRNS
jgi:hypothetical protein